MFGVCIIYSIPILIFIIPLVISMIAMPLFISNASSSQQDALFPIFMLIIFGTLCVLIPLSLPLAVIIPGAEMHVMDKNEFAAGFRIREW